MPNWRNFGRNHKNIKCFKYPVPGEPGYCPAYRNIGHGEEIAYFRYIGEELERIIRLSSGPVRMYHRTMCPDGLFFTGERIVTRGFPIPSDTDTVEWSRVAFEY